MTDIIIDIDKEQFKTALDLHDGKDGIDGKTPVAGIDFPLPKDGIDGKDGIGIPGIDGKNGSPDSPIEVRDKLQTLQGDERLDVNAIKGLEAIDETIKSVSFLPRTLDALYDVDAKNPQNTQALVYNSTTKKWQPGTATGGGGVSSISKLGSSALTGAVTLSEGSNITLTQVGNDIEIAASISGGGVSGSGTTNKLTKWTDGAGSVIGDSSVLDDGTITTIDNGFVLSSEVQVTLADNSVHFNYDLEDHATIDIVGVSPGFIRFVGFAGGTLGRRITFNNLSSAVVKFLHGGGGSTIAGNQIDLPDGKDIFLDVFYSSVTFVYYGQAWSVESLSPPTINVLTDPGTRNKLIYTWAGGNGFLENPIGSLHIFGNDVAGFGNTINLFSDSITVNGYPLTTANFYTPSETSPSAAGIGTSGSLGQMFLYAINETNASGALLTSPLQNVLDFIFKGQNSTQTMRLQATTGEVLTNSAVEFQFGPTTLPYNSLGDRGLFTKWGGYKNFPTPFNFVGTYDSTGMSTVDNTTAAATSYSTPFQIVAGTDEQTFYMVFHDDTNGTVDNFPTSIYFDITTPADPSFYDPAHGGRNLFTLQYLAKDGNYYDVPITPAEDGTLGFTQSGTIKLPDYLMTQGVIIDDTTWDYGGVDANTAAQGYTLRIQVPGVTIITPPEARLVIPEGNFNYAGNYGAEPERGSHRAQSFDTSDYWHESFHGDITWNADKIARTFNMHGFLYSNTLIGTGAVLPSVLNSTGTDSSIYFWNPKLGAFWAGEWDIDLADTDVGLSSNAFGYDNIASGDYSFAAGDSNVSSGQSSGTLGHFNINGGNKSFAAGNGNEIASGAESSFATGIANVIGVTSDATVIGNTNEIQDGASDSQIFGNSNTIEANCYDNIIIGSSGIIRSASGSDATGVVMFGDSNIAEGDISFAYLLGLNLKNTGANNSITIGKGASYSLPLLNTTDNSFLIGMGQYGVFLGFSGITTSHKTVTFQNQSGTMALTTGQTYSASNVTTDRTYDANATTLDELADVLGTLIADLRSGGIVN